MPSVPDRMLDAILLLCFGLATAQIAHAQVIHAVPIPGDQFVVHYEQVSSGTFTLEGTPPGKFRTSMTSDFTALVVRNVTQTHGWEASYRYDYLRIESQVDEASPTLLEIWPSRMSVDGTITYDTRLHPDVPPPMLVQVLLGDFRVRVGNQGDLLRIDESEKYHDYYPFLDLTQPFRDTWMHRPPEPLQIGMKWAEDRPFHLWANRLTIPASQTYEVKALPPVRNSPVSLSLFRTLQINLPRRIPIPVGSQALPVLRFDALGSDIQAPPPDLTISFLSLTTQGIVGYRLDRGFLESKQTRDRIDVQMAVPLPDGQEMLDKRMRVDRTTNITVTYYPAGKFSEEARLILFGR